MKRKLAVMFLFLAFTTVNVFCEGVMKVIVDNFEITVPGGWLAQRTDSPTVFMLYSPIEEYDTFQENGNLVVEKLPAKYSVKGYLEAGRESLKKFYGDFKLIEEGKNYQIISGNLNGNYVQQIMFAEMNGLDAYVLTFSSNPENFDRYLETFKTIYKSFKY